MTGRGKVKRGTGAEQGVDQTSQIPVIFDRGAVRRHRARAATFGAGHDALLEEVADRLAGRLDDVRHPFSRALVLGRHRGAIGAKLAGRGGIRWLVESDPCEAFARLSTGPSLVADEELLPFADGALDLIVSFFALHWVNDLPGALVQMRRALRPDGLFLAALPGGETLRELRAALGAAEIECEGGLSPRVSPFVDVRDAGNLLQRAGFALPVADCETITVMYQSPLDLCRDLRGLGETNGLASRRRGLSRRSTLQGAFDRYGALRGEGGAVPATFQIVFLIGWAPHPSQPRSLPRGSGAMPLGRALAGEGPPSVPAANRSPRRPD